jgi:hypothetical protein
MKRLLLILTLLAQQSLASEATVGDFGTNQQAETITTTSETTVNQEGMPVTTAVAPSTPTYQADTCIVTSGAGMQTLQIGFSTSKMTRDENCERLKLSRQLSQLGLKVAATSVLCQDPRVFWAMRDAQTPCPIKGLIGEEALEFYTNNPEYVPKRLVVDHDPLPVKSKGKCERKRIRYDRITRRYIYDEQCDKQ